MTTSKKRNFSSSFLASFLVPSLVFGTFATTLAGCPDREVAQVNPRPNKEQQKEIPVQINRDIDILFVIDNSGSMREEQDSLAANFNRFINVLNNIDGGLPNIHIGVVSTDVGAGVYNIDGCGNDGDNGRLQYKTANGSSCLDDAGQFIQDTTSIDPVTKAEVKKKNYSGDLAETFSCMAQLGTKGCGLEQPLESMERALNQSTNPGFLRPDAFLAVIIITDEDDCSVEDSSMFDPNNAALGALTSFRCFEYGIKCEPDDNPRAVGPRQNCVPRIDSDYMYNVDKYATALKGLKKDPGQIIVAGIIGNPTPVNIGTYESGANQGEPSLNASCTGGTGEADPGIRLQAFLDQFPNRNTSTTICNEDLSDALTVIADLLAKVIGNPCMEGDIALTDGQPTECNVQDTRYKGTDKEVGIAIPQCNAEKSNIPCYHFITDTDNCAETKTQLSLVVERGQASVPPDTRIEVSCLSN